MVDEFQYDDCATSSSSRLGSLRGFPATDSSPSKEVDEIGLAQVILILTSLDIRQTSTLDDHEQNVCMQLESSKIFFKRIELETFECKYQSTLTSTN